MKKLGKESILQLLINVCEEENILNRISMTQ